MKLQGNTKTDNYLEYGINKESNVEDSGDRREAELVIALMILNIESNTYDSLIWRGQSLVCLKPCLNRIQYTDLEECCMMCNLKLDASKSFFINFSF